MANYRVVSAPKDRLFDAIRNFIDTTVEPDDSDSLRVLLMNLEELAKIEGPAKINITQAAMLLRVSEEWLMGYDVPMDYNLAPEERAERSLHTHSGLVDLLEEVVTLSPEDLAELVDTLQLIS